MTPLQIRRIILEQAWRARVGYIGSALSIADIIAALYGHVLQIPGPSAPDCDRFILSKRHAVLAVYAALFLKGWISSETLNTFCVEGSLLGVNPEHKLQGIDFSTGSLGQGLSMGVGAALAARLQHGQRRVFVLLSDAECNEGSTWEAVMFAAHHQLANLIAIVEINGQQSLGYTKQILNLSPMAALWQAFGWNTHEVDGHSVADLTALIGSLNTSSGAPHVIIAHTIFGKGVSYMERRIKWHYWPMSDQEYYRALADIGANA